MAHDRFYVTPIHSRVWNPSPPPGQPFFRWQVPVAGSISTAPFHTSSPVRKSICPFVEHLLPSALPPDFSALSVMARLAHHA